MQTAESTGSVKSQEDKQEEDEILDSAEDETQEHWFPSQWHQSHSSSLQWS